MVSDSLHQIVVVYIFIYLLAPDSNFDGLFQEKPDRVRGVYSLIYDCAL